MVIKVWDAIIDGTFVPKLKHKISVILKAFLMKYYKNLPVNKRKIVFDNFGGRGYGDHPKYIAEEIHRRGLKWDIVWLVRNMDEPMPEWIRKVDFNSWRAIFELTTAKMWVDNIRNAHLIPKKKGQVYLQTWHGSFPTKLCEGEDEGSLSTEYIEAAKYDGSITDGFIASNEMQAARVRKYFWLSEKTEILKIGDPRTDCLFDKIYISEKRKQIREKLHLEEEDYIILYAPTYRENEDFSVYGMLDYRKIANVVNCLTGRNCKIMIRLHPNLGRKKVNIINSDNIIDGLMIPDVNDALIISDAVITDFSGLVYEAYLLGKVIYRYAPDYEEYIQRRKIYQTIIQLPFPIARTTEELIEQIEKTDIVSYNITADSFFARIKPYIQGHGSEQAVNWLMEKRSR